MSERLMRVNPDSVHVYPVDDLRKHVTDAGHDCWCEPTVETGATFSRWAAGSDEEGPPTESSSGMLVIHQSLDGREWWERPNR